MKSDLQFALRVSEPSIDHGFRKLSKAAADPIDDVWEATCKAVCLAPDKFAGREAAVRIYANDALRADRRSAGQAVNLGQVFANTKSVEAILYLLLAECWGVVAWFEMEQRNKTRLGYVFLRQVEEPPPTKHWY